jgi:hypothetical protein
MAEQIQRPPLPEPNPITMQAHRRESFWQIKLPLGIAIGVVVLSAVCVVVASVTGAGNISGWADISVMWLILLITPPVLIFSAITAALIYLLAQVIPMLPRYSRLLLGYFILVRERVGKISQISVEPVLRVHSWSASLRAFKDSLLGKQS